jgi:hypothetical protein
VTLRLNVTNWTIADTDKYLTLSWNYNGTELKMPYQEPLLIIVNLAVPLNRDFINFLVKNSVSSFNFDMTIYASDE